MTQNLVPANLLGALRTLIEGARQRAAVAVNQEMVLLYWKIGQRIHSELLGEEPAHHHGGTRVRMGRFIARQCSRT